MLAKELGQGLEYEDPNQFEVQKAAIIAVLQEPSAESLSLLHEVIRSYQNPILIKITVTVLSEIASPEAIAILVHTLFEHQDLAYRRDAARALGYSRSSQALPALKKILESPVEEADEQPITEALWAVMSLAQVGLLKPDAEWDALLSIWQQQAGEVALLARVILQCLQDAVLPEL